MKKPIELALIAFLAIIAPRVGATHASLSDQPTPPIFDPVVSTEPTTQQIDLIFSSVTAPDAPGLAVLVRKDDRVVFERGYGVGDLRARAKIDAATNFRLASCTKQFTAMAVMLLVHDHKLTYETKLNDIFPDFPAYGKSITIRNLLNHTSGLQDYEDLMGAAKPANKPPLWTEARQIQDSEVLKLLEQQTTTKFPPGTKWAYSNSGYVVLGLVVAKISGEPFGDFLRDRIFAPLNMQNTIVYVKGKNEVANRALGYSKNENAWQDTDQSPTSATLGDGGAYSSLDDLAKWNEGLNNHVLLSEKEMQPTLAPVNVPHAAAAAADTEANANVPANALARYGFGWFLDPYKGHQRMWHDGGTSGFRTTIQRFTSDHLTIVILCNRTDLNPSALAERVADLFFEPQKSGSLAPMKPPKFPLWLQQLVAVMGGGGLFVVTFLDSSVLSFPFIADALVIELSSEHPARMPYYAAMAGFGSLAGCVWLYLLAKKGGEAYFHRRAGKVAIKAKRWVGSNAFLNVFIPAILPPPFPFKVFVLAEGVFQVPLRTFVVALLLGRSLRYVAEGLFGVKYGQQALLFLTTHGGAFVIATLILFLLLYAIVRIFVHDKPDSR